MPDNMYWAAAPPTEVASDIITRIDSYYKYLETVGLRAIWQKSYDFFNRVMDHRGSLLSSGEAGEYVLLYANHYRNLLQHLYTLATNQRPFFEAQGVNSDSKTQKQVFLAQGILEYYLKQLALERYLNSAVKHAILFGEGFIAVDWDQLQGEDYAVNQNMMPGEENASQVIKTGEITYQDLTPLDVVRDITKEDSLNHNWIVTRHFRNRYDLMARYPELADKIESETKNSSSQERRYWTATKTGYETDLCIEWVFVHRKTESMPYGRMVKLLSDEIVLEDGPLPYKEIPVYRVSAGDIAGSIFGYSVAFDLLPLQEVVDVLHSIIVTNQQAFGVQSLHTQKGNSINVQDLTKGLRLIETDGPNPPTPLQLTATPAEVPGFLNQVITEMETISGINSVVRGEPQENLKSGTAIALVQSTAIQFSMDLQRSYSQLAEDVGTATVRILQEYANVPKVASIVGRANKPYLRSFSKEDLDLIDRITVNMGNPLLRTTAGKVNMAEMLVTAGLIESPQQFLEVINTGKTEPLLEGEMAELLLIRDENESLGEGNNVPVLVTDKHNLHIPEHASVGATVEARNNPQLMSALTQHIQEHLDQMRQMDATLATLLKVPVTQTIPPEASEALANENPITQAAGDVPQVRAPKAPPGASPDTAALIENSLPPSEPVPTV